MFRIEFYLALCLLICFAPTHAVAGTTTITFTGIIYEGFDSTGEFGTPNLNLAGMRFETKYFLDFKKQDITFYSDDNYSTAFGGARDRNTSPLSATVNIGGQIRSILGSYLGVAARLNDYTGIYDSLEFKVQESSFGTPRVSNLLYNNVSSRVNNFLTSSQFDGAVNYRVQDTDQISGRLQLLTYSGRTDLNRMYAEFRNETVSVVTDDIGSVPEPKNWALMTTGFLLIGGALRNGRQLRVAYWRGIPRT